MKLLMTADAVGGVFTYATNLCAALREHGVEVVLATMGPAVSRARRATLAALGNVRLYESEYKLEWMPNPWEDVERAGCWLQEIAAHERVDCVHLNGYVHGSFEFDVPKLAVAHSCVLSWWCAVRGEDPPPEWEDYRARVSRGLSAVDVVVAPTAAMLEQIRRFYGATARTMVIFNGSDSSPTPVLAKHSYVLSAGRLWDNAKNMQALDHAASHLAWPVYAAGSTSGPHGERTQLSHLRLLGELSSIELTRCLATAAIYALPARYEPFGLSVLEAARASCALVLGDIRSLRELWDGAAWFVPPEDPAALARALRELIDDPGARERAGHAAAVRAKRFGMTRMAKAYVELYRQLIQERRIGEKSRCAS